MCDVLFIACEKQAYKWLCQYVCACVCSDVTTFLKRYFQPIGGLGRVLSANSSASLTIQASYWLRCLHVSQ